MSGRLTGKVAIITGALGGFGREIVRRFVDQGAKVVGVDRTTEGAENLQAEFAGNLRILQGDHTRREDNEAAVACALETWGTLDILVNNAGIGLTGELEGVDDEAFSHIMDVNLAGYFKLTQAALPAMLNDYTATVLSRSVIFLSSGLGLYGVAKSAPYTASKHAVIGLMRALAAEYGPQGVRVNAICPGISDTNLGRATAAWASSPEEVFEGLRRVTQLRRLIEPEDIANTAVFLASDEGRMVHSVALRVDGGAHV